MRADHRLLTCTVSAILVFSRCAGAQTSPQPKPDMPDPLREAFDRPALAWKDIEALALEHNPTLKQAGALVRRSAGQARQAGLYPNPVIGYQGEQIRGGAFRGGEQGAFVQQSIVLGGKLGLRHDVFEQQRRADEIGVVEQRYRVLGEVGTSFYSALAAQEVLKVRQRLQALALDAVETARQLGNVGQADAPDILQAEVEAEQAGVDFIAAQRAYIQEFRVLAALAGKPDLPLAPLAGDLEALPPIAEDAIERIVRDSPSVKRARQEVARAEAELKSARRQPFPDLQLSAGIQQNREVIQESSNRAVGLQGFASAGIKLPIFNRNQGNIDAARADLEVARAEVTRTELALRQTAERLVQTALADRQQAARYKNEMLPRATRAYQLYLAKYRQMGAAYPQVIVSQRTLFQLQVAYIRMLRDVWRHAIALQNFTLGSALNSPQPRRASRLDPMTASLEE